MSAAGQLEQRQVGLRIVGYYRRVLFLTVVPSNHYLTRVVQYMAVSHHVAIRRHDERATASVV